MRVAPLLHDGVGVVHADAGLSAHRVHRRETGAAALLVQGVGGVDDAMLAVGVHDVPSCGRW